MDVNGDKNTPIQHIVAEGEAVSSSILWQCLCVIKSMPEFQNLTYRITKARNGSEVVVVYREGVLGVFGPPVDPITLTIDPKGKCLLTVMFKPVERVSIVSQDSGQIDVASLLTVLKLVAGKGYFFCPGIPEKFLSGKVFGKFVIMHRVPFKRYQSAHCPVYYQNQGLQQNGSSSKSSSSLCAICPRCLQAARLTRTIPPVVPSPASSHSAQFSVFGIPGPDHKMVAVNGFPGVTQLLGFPVVSPTPASLSHQDLPLKYLQNQPVDCSGNRQTLSALKDGTMQSGSQDMTGQVAHMNGQIKLLKSYLLDLLNAQNRKSDLLDKSIKRHSSGVGTENKNKNKHGNSEKGQCQRRNTCRLCRKQFSTAANLLNHIQRHEALSGPWQKHFLSRKMQIKTAISTVRHKSIKKYSAWNNRKAGGLSKDSIQIILQCLDSISPLQNGTSKVSLKQDVEDTGGQLDHAATDKHSMEIQPLSEMDVLDSNTNRVRAGLKRPSSGLSPMQTLLHAAAIADVEQGSNNVPPINSPLVELLPDSHQQPPILISASQVPTVAGQDDASLSPKKSRKGARLVSKKERKRKRGDNSVVESEAAAASHEQSWLTNLNLLSTVSVQTAMKHAPDKLPENSSMAGLGRPAYILLSPDKKPNLNISSSVCPPGQTASLQAVKCVVGPANGPMPCSVGTLSPQSMNIPQQLLNNMSGGNVVISTAQATSSRAPVHTTSGQSSSSLPPLPPLLFAGEFLSGQSVSIPAYSPRPQGSLTSSQASSILRNLVTVTSSDQQRSSQLQRKEPDSNASSLSPVTECGAIDLSKPKISPISNIPLNLDKSFDFNSGLPHNIAQFIARSENPSEALKCFMSMAKSGVSSAEAKELNVQSFATNEKHSDSDLQARMFASARNYRIENAVKNAPQVQAVIAGSNHLNQIGKGAKSGKLGAVPPDEIQCGYKWSGSGGLVKERTQMVRELVPPDVMASFIAKNKIPANAGRQISSKIFNSLPPQLQVPQIAAPSMPIWTAHSKHKDLSPAELALNLMTGRPPEVPMSTNASAVRLHKPVAATVIPSSSALLQSTSMSSLNSVNRSILRSSLTSPQVGPPSAGPSPLLLQSKALSASSSPIPFLLATPLSSSSSRSSVSSPSLVAMLRQPVTALHESNHGSIQNITHIQVKSHQHPSSDSHPSNDTPPAVCVSGMVPVKEEPSDPSTPVFDQGMISMGLSLKAETMDMVVLENSERGLNHHENGSPTNLVVDISPLTYLHKENNGRQNSIVTSVAMSSDVSKKINSVKCKH